MKPDAQAATILRHTTPVQQLHHAGAMELQTTERVANDSTDMVTQGLQDEVHPASELISSEDWDTNEGWLAVAAGSCIFFVYLGLVYSYGIVQLHLSEARLASVSTLSFIGTVGAAVSPLTGMIVARILNRFGHRTTAFAGGVLLGLGEFTAGWSTGSVPAMFITQGATFGIGAALLFLVCKIVALLKPSTESSPTASRYHPVVVVQKEARISYKYRLWRRRHRFCRNSFESGQADPDHRSRDGFEDSWGSGMGDLSPGILLPEGTCRTQ